MAKTAKGGLGKGFGALLGESLRDDPEESAGISTLPMALVEPNPDQPRKVFDREAMEALKQSIATHGVITPITVRAAKDGYYQIIAGERRWRAARSIGLTEIPAMVIEADDSQVMELALIENLQREDLSPLEEATGYQALMEQYGFTQEDVARSVGKSRPVIANALRLLNLPEEVRDMLSEGLISAGHARTLLSFPDEDSMIDAAKQVVLRDLTVRDLERMARAAAQVEKEAAKQPVRRAPYYDEVQLALKDYLGRKVKVDSKGKKGTLQIEFYGEDDLAALMEKLNLNR